MLTKMKFSGFPGLRRQGFTIVEIVMAFIIIGILTMVMVPVLTSRANDARINAAEQDLEHLAEAQSRACSDTGYLFRPYVLNDVPNGDGIPNYPEPGITGSPDPSEINVVNGIRDNGTTAAGKWSIYSFPHRIFIAQRTGDYLSTDMEDKLFCRLTTGAVGTNVAGDLWDTNTNTANAERNFRWNGPYINWRRDVNNNDWPDDPWGHDYLFFTKAGVLYPPDGSRASTGSGEPGGGSTTAEPDPDPGMDNSYPFRNASPDYTIGTGTVSFPAVLEVGENADRGGFDRPTWLSLGPDGIPGSLSANGEIDENDTQNYGFGRGDDIFRSF